MNRPVFIGIATILGLVLQTDYVCADVRFDGDLLYLSARNESLIDVLEDFTRVGVDVHVEPGIDAMVSGTIDGEDVDEAMGKLLESFNYVLFWDVLEGPVGPLPRLDAIHVFRPGKRRLVRRLDPDPTAYEVTRHPLRVNEPYVKDELLVGLKHGVTAEEFRSLLARLGATIVSSIPEMGIYKLRLPEDTDVLAAMKQLQAQDQVAAVEPNYIYDLPRTARAGEVAQTLPDPDGPRVDNSQPSDSARSSSEGFVRANPQDPSLAIFDSGLMANVDLDGSVLGRYDAVDPSRSLSDPIGHGTQMAMIAAGSVVPHGVDPSLGQQRVPLVAVRAFDDSGRATSVGLIQGIQYAIEQGVRVINMSWGTESNSQFLQDAIKFARDNGIVVVASAGNEPTQRPVYPAAFDNVIGVSAMNPDGNLWEKSNHGRFVSAAAPGTGQFPIGHKGPPGSYAGTSIASAYTARALTRYFQQNPDASVDDAEKAFFASLTDAGPSGKDNKYGRGALDDEALKKLLGSK